MTTQATFKIDIGCEDGCGFENCARMWVRLIPRSPEAHIHKSTTIHYDALCVDHRALGLDVDVLEP